MNIYTIEKLSTDKQNSVSLNDYLPLKFTVMRLLIGIITLLIILTGATLTILALWGIQPISWTIILKSGITIAIIAATWLVSSIIYFFFLKREPFKRSNKD